MASLILSDAAQRDLAFLTDADRASIDAVRDAVAGMPDDLLANLPASPVDPAVRFILEGRVTLAVALLPDSVIVVHDIEVEA